MSDLLLVLWSTPDLASGQALLAAGRPYLWAVGSRLRRPQWLNGHGLNRWTWHGSDSSA